MSAASLHDLAVRAAHAAGVLLLDRFGSKPSGIQSKSTRTDLVSDADRDAEALIIGMIREARPEDGIVAEEGSGAPGATGIRWLVDPLDGTVNFLWGHPHWSVSVAAVDVAGDIAGVVHDPGRGETFSAERGRGAWLSGVPLTLRESSDLGEALVATGFAYGARERAGQAAALETVLPRVRDIRRAGSAALDLAWVAAGRLDAFFEAGLAPWDWAAGAALVRLAGGEAEMIDRGGDRSPVMIATRPGLMRPLRGLLEVAGVLP